MEYVFIADDNQYKLEGIAGTLSRLYPRAVFVQTSCASEILRALRIGYAQVIRNRPWECLVVLDLQMPREPDKAVDPRCGYFVLSCLQEHSFVCPAIITSADVIDDTAARQSYKYYIGSINYDKYHLQDVLYKQLIDKFYKEFYE